MTDAEVHPAGGPAEPAATPTVAGAETRRTGGSAAVAVGGGGGRADGGATTTVDGATHPAGVPTPAARAPQAAAIELDGLVRRYGEREALSEVSLRLERGHTLVVFGPNGAGKTTLLRVLATLLRAHAGGVRVLGCELPGEAWRVRGRVGLLAHEPLLYRELSARENLRYHARLHGVAPERVDERLAAVGMGERADEPLRTFSRGMVQRAAIARATLHDPELLLLDEPYANLDPAAIELIAPLIGPAQSLAHDPKRPRTRVLCSHDPARGLAEADLVLGLRAGRVAFVRAAGETDTGEIAELYR